MSAIAFNDRVLVLGETGSGKSELINVLISRMAGGAQRVLLDTKAEFHVDGVDPATSVAAIDWRQPVVHFQLAAPTIDQVEELFSVLTTRRRIVVCVHELSDLCDYNAGKTPPSVNRYLSMGRARGQGLIGGTQRPVNIPKRILTDAQHNFVFASGFPDDSDQKAAAMTLNLPRAQALQTLGELHERYGRHAYLHFDRTDRAWSAYLPLSEAERRGNVVQRLSLY